MVLVAEYAYGVAVRSAVCPPRVSRARVVIQPRYREHVTWSRSHAVTLVTLPAHTVMKLEAVLQNILN